MRISELAGLTSLSLEQLGAEVVGGHVVTALPVDTDHADRGSVLVATERRLGVVGHHGDNVHEGLITLWAPWDIVSLETEGLVGRTGVDDPATSHLVVRVGNRRFVAMLEGAAGKAAVDDFVLAVEAPHGVRVASVTSASSVAPTRTDHDA